MAGILISKANHIRHLIGTLSLGNMLDIIKVNSVGGCASGPAFIC